MVGSELGAFRQAAYEATNRRPLMVGSEQSVPLSSLIVSGHRRPLMVGSEQIFELIGRVPSLDRRPLMVGSERNGGVVLMEQLLHVAVPSWSGRNIKNDGTPTLVVTVAVPSWSGRNYLAKMTELQDFRSPSPHGRVGTVR